MPKVKAVIFDLDDTLFAERAYAFSGFDAVAAGMEDVLGDRERSAARMQRLFDTEERARVFDVLLDERGSPGDGPLRTRMIEIYRSHTPVINLHPDADAVLTRLHGHYKLGLITDGRAGQQWAKIDALGLRTRLDEIIVTAELSEAIKQEVDPVHVATGPPIGRSAGAPASKPSPTAFERMARRLEVEPTACVYVADNPAKDFLGPRALGWRTVRIRRPDGIYRDLPYPSGGAAQHQIETLDALDALLR